MLIVLEGCDGTGKTTLATWLSKVLNAEIIHCTTKTPNTLKFFEDIIALSKERNIIADRWCYGQFVYQDEDDRPMAFDDYNDRRRSSRKSLNYLEKVMLENEVKLVLVTAPTEVIEQRLKARNETLLNNLTVSEIQKRFNDLRRHSLLNWIEYNTGGEKDGV